jgi:hypothetical protein
MTESNLLHTETKMLARFLELEDVPSQIWPHHELGAILRHQLATSVQLDLEGHEASFRKRFQALPPAQQPGNLTFAELFHQAAPPLELLNWVKQFAKASRVRGESALPAEIATVVYLMSIVVARLRCNKRISEQSDESLTYGIQWVIDQPWVDESTRQLFRDALLYFRPSINAGARN